MMTLIPCFKPNDPQQSHRQGPRARDLPMFMLPGSASYRLPQETDRELLCKVISKVTVHKKYKNVGGGLAVSGFC